MTQPFYLSYGVRHGGSILEFSDYSPTCIDKSEELKKDNEFKTLYNRMMGNKLNSKDKEKCLKMMKERGYIG